MSNANLIGTPMEILSSARAVLVIDWPTVDVPNRLAASGLQVYVKGGPLETDFAIYAAHDGEVQREPMGHSPDRVDFIYAYRPISEMPEIMERAKQLSARAVWFQSGKVLKRSVAAGWINQIAIG
jgi:CoA binding domain